MSATIETPIKENVVITDDWTRNWQAKIAVKITAMFLWVIILSGFGTVVYFTQELDEHIGEEISHDLDALAFQIQDSLQKNAPASDRELIQRMRLLSNTVLNHHVSEVFSHRPISGIRISAGDQSDILGEISTELNSYSRSISQNAEIEAYYPSNEQIINQTRQRLVIAVVAILLVFGFLLRVMIQNVLAKPFQVLMDATQSVSNGDMDLRLDVSREDEFGHLSRFFNQMLERIQTQQVELTEANKELINEITVRKDAEKNLRTHQEALEKLVEERTSDLAVARDQALAASQTKSAFIANISHEIRTPLTPIIGFAEAMLNSKQSTEVQEQSLKTIIRNGRHLSQIINEILDLSKIEANSLDVEKIEINPFSVVADVESIVSVIAQEKGLEFSVEYEYPVPQKIFNDPTRIKQILMNLATNAVKFTDKGEVKFRVCYDDLSRQLLVSVSDTGIGVSAEKRKRLFKPFSQADHSTTRKYGGTGLGLYISKRMANLMGGDISLESIEGVGARFTVTLCVGEHEDLELAYKLPSLKEDEFDELIRLGELHLSGNILLAEDSPDIQCLMQFLLKRTGANVTLVENGELAVEAVLKDDFDLILMDMQMPVMGGLEAVEILRTTGCSIPIIALTANAMKEDQQRYSEIGCDGFLSKPVEQNKLYKTLSKHLSSENEVAVQKAEPPATNPVFENLVNRFVDSLDDYADRIKVGLEGGDFELVRELAHQLKGSGGSFGYPEITTRAAELESALKAEQFQSARELVTHLTTLLHSNGRRNQTPETLT